MREMEMLALREVLDSCASAREAVYALARKHKDMNAGLCTVGTEENNVLAHISKAEMWAEALLKEGD